MCQLFGFTSKKPVAFNKYWDKFVEVAAPQNPDGWGLAFYTPELTVVKEPVPAHESIVARTFTLQAIPAYVAIGHVRLASRGAVNVTNTHPFYAHAQDKDWAFAHNGHMVKYPKGKKALGQTDSEAVFRAMVEIVSAMKADDPEDIADVLAGVTETTVGKLNFLLSDGESLWVHASYQGTLYVLHGEGAAMFCTKPITRHKGWRSLEANRVYVYRDGVPVYKSRPVKKEKEGDLWSSYLCLTNYPDPNRNYTQLAIPALLA
ncbi:MAG: class II glutamine amidotransferase [Armatimonadetes bacterium]|nr:class II glutamine amidotransferase [Armatimonadota bacterium]